MIRISEIPTAILSGIVFAVAYPAMVLHSWIFGSRGPALEVQPAEEMPHIPVRVKVFLVTPDRPEPNEYWRGKTVDQICRELSEGLHA